MTDFILWCNTNQGFVNVIFSACSLLISTVAIFISIMTALRPYRKAVSCCVSLQQSSDGIVGQVAIVNTGNRPMYITQINVRTRKEKLNVGSRVKTHKFNLIPGMEKTAHIRIFDAEEQIIENMIDLNQLLYIEVRDTENKVYVCKDCFAVG